MARLLLKRNSLPQPDKNSSDHSEVWNGLRRINQEHLTPFGIPIIDREKPTG
jgi:hypothetical protein